MGAPERAWKGAGYYYTPGAMWGGRPWIGVPTPNTLSHPYVGVTDVPAAAVPKGEEPMDTIERHLKAEELWLTGRLAEVRAAMGAVKDSRRGVDKKEQPK